MSWFCWVCVFVCVCACVEGGWVFVKWQEEGGSQDSEERLGAGGHA